MKAQIQFMKVRNVKSPQRKPGDAGIDMFIPEFSQELVDYIRLKNPTFEEEGGRLSQTDIVIPAGVGIIIPTGLKYKIPGNVALIQFTKSGVGAKKKLDCFNGVGDSTYQGELHIHLINQGSGPQSVEYGEKITQFVPVEYNTSEISVEDFNEKFFDRKTERGEGGFGSTGNK